jgi:hypothetical protein
MNSRTMRNVITIITNQSSYFKVGIDLIHYENLSYIDLLDLSRYRERNKAMVKTDRMNINHCIIKQIHYRYTFFFRCMRYSQF